MRRTLTFLLCVTTLTYCSSDKGAADLVIYDKGDFWVEEFRNYSFPSKAFYQDRLFCTSMEISSGRPKYLYSLDLKTGLVDWASPVDSWATQPPIVSDSFIYYCSYVGDIYKFDMNGVQKWKVDMRGSYSGHCINPKNNNLFVSSIETGVYEFDFENGTVVNHYGDNSLGTTLPVFYNDLMIVGTGFELNGSGNRKENLICTNSIDKSEIWKVETGGVERRLFINDGKLFFFDEGGALNCISVHDGTKIWQTDSLSKLNVYTTFPHMTFEGSQIIVYGSDLNNMVVLDSATGRTVDQGSYIEMRLKNRMPTSSSSYRIKKSDKVFVVSVSDSLESAADYRQTFNVKIVEGTYR